MSKRDADNQDAANKRRRLSTPSNDELEALLNDDDNEVLLNDITSGSDEGFIAGSIQSTWPPTKKNLRIKLDTFTTCNRNGKVTFDIEVIFVADCLHAINKLEPESQFEVGDHIKLALHGFSVTTSTGSSGIVKLRLTFEDGAAFMFLAKPRHPEQTHKLISIWPDRKRERYRVSLETTPEWFATPQDAASPTENDVPKVEATSPIVLPPVKISKAEKKRLRSQKHRQESFHRTSADLKKTIQTARESLDREPPPVSSEHAEKEEALAELKAAAGRYTLPASYKSLDFVNDPAITKNIPCNVVGVVASIEEVERTAGKNELIRRISLVDPTNCSNENIYMPRIGIKVNCFTKQYPQWLPQAKPGDVLVLHDARTSAFAGGVNLAGYPNRLRWATYDAETSRSGHGNRGTAPWAESLGADNGGRPFCPFYVPAASDVPIFQRLVEWWAALQRWKTLDLGCEHQIGGDEGLDSAHDHQKTSRRPHLLISEAGSTAAPQGYFDCTVEILYGRMNDDNRTYSLYVTDYTAPANAYPQTGPWCSPKLQGLVLQIELWDEAKQSGPELKQGDYYLIKNVRMCSNARHYDEGKVQEQKMTRLDPEQRDYPPLNALIERKEKWMASSTQTFDTLQDLEFRFLKDFPLDTGHHHCVVEILHVVLHGPDSATMHCTDYSSRVGFASAPPNLDGGEGLAGRVVEIRLEGSQVHTAQSLVAGAFCVLKNLALRLGTSIKGKLGGSEQLIHAINDAGDLPSSVRDHLGSVNKLKEEWKTPVTKTKLVTVAEAIDDKQRVKHRVAARVISVYPEQIEDFTVVRCLGCDLDLDIVDQTCPQCSKPSKYTYRFFLKIEDAEQGSVILCVKDHVKLLKGLHRGSLRHNTFAKQELKKVVGPIIGNAIHASSKADLTTQRLVFTLEKWEHPEDPDDPIVYGFVDCAPA